MLARTRKPRLLLGVACGALALATPALAGWMASVSGGAQALSSASLAAPDAVAAARGACTRFQASLLAVDVTWSATASPGASGYLILRGRAATGPFTQVGAVTGIGTTAWTDATGQLAFRTTYYYVVESTVQSWTSPDSSPASVTTPNSRCR